MKPQLSASPHGRGVQSFLAAHPADVTGVISGFDRLRLRASLRWLYQPTFMKRYLCEARVLLKDFGAYATSVSHRIRAAAHAFAAREHRPVRYLHSTALSKEELARSLAARDRVREGLIGLFDIVEPCLTYFVKGDRAAHRLHLELRPGKCLHHYFYFQHAEFGLMHLRVQSWFPFQVTVCLNGRLWLARQFDRAGLGYVQRDNSFVWLADPARAQQLADRQARTALVPALEKLLHHGHPLAAELCRPLGLSYYWSVDQSEYATDFMFKSPAALAAIYPRLVQHGIQHCGSADVLRFLGRTVPAHGKVHRGYQGEVETSLTHRPEGVRLKHYAAGNSIKIYDKHGQVLRVETTMNHPEAFRVYRTPEGQPHRRKKWRPLRKAVADLPRRAQLCAAANDRYLAALATVPTGAAAGELARPVCQPIVRRGRRHRALNPWADTDATLLQTVARGEWTVHGFRNRDLRAALYQPTRDDDERRSQAGRVTRLLALLRAHGLIKKVTGTHRYLLTTKGRQLTTTLLAAQHASVEQLLKLAA
jgi:hypothetical protein